MTTSGGSGSGPYAPASSQVDLTGATDGQVVTVQANGSLAPEDASVAAHAASHMPGGSDPVVDQLWLTGVYYDSRTSSTGLTVTTLNTVLLQGVMTAAPLDCPGCNIDRIAVQVTVASAAGGLIRMLVFADSGGKPSGPDLLAMTDGQRIDATVQAVDFSPPASVFNPVKALPRGRLWVCAKLEGSPATPPTVRVFAGQAKGMPLSSSSSFATGANGWQVTGLADGAVANWPGGETIIVNSVLVAVRPV